MGKARVRVLLRSKYGRPGTVVYVNHTDDLEASERRGVIVIEEGGREKVLKPTTPAKKVFENPKPGGREQAKADKAKEAEAAQSVEVEPPVEPISSEEPPKPDDAVVGGK